MSQQHRPGGPRSRRPRRAALGAAVVVLGAAALTSGCTAAVNDDVSRGWLPTTADTTTTTALSENLWVGSWIAALIVGVITWGLMLWCVVRFRRRRNDSGLPPQLRYNVPVEMLFTVMPLLMVGVLFYFTARDQQIIENKYTNPAVNITVVGKRWAWDFNYTDANVYDAGIQAQEDAGGIDEDAPGTIPTLYLPVGEKVLLTLQSRDVIHDFYVPAFSYKKDVIPGHTNYMSITPTKEGTYIGRCAELCGEGHSRMLFKVAVVTPQQYQQHLADLAAAGQTGALPADLGPDHSVPGTTEDSVGQDAGGQNTLTGGNG